jgi:hypothetical protein
VLLFLFTCRTLKIRNGYNNPVKRKIGGEIMEDLESFKYETGTSMQTFNIIQTNVNEEGYEVLLNIDLDSGYELEDVRLKISFEDLTAYETKDIHEGVKFALGFFNE